MAIDRQRIANVSLFIVPFIIGLGYLLAFYPGVLSFDSLSQWSQLSQFKFSNWHPAYHTILMWLITRVWHSPAAVAVFQIFVFSMVVGYGLLTFRKEFGVPYALLFTIGAVISTVPLNGIMVITLWKDVLYSICVLLLTIYVLRLIYSQGVWITSGYNWICFGVITANISLLRHNGFPVAYGTLFVCMFFFSYHKHFVKALAVSLLFIMIVVGPMYKIFKVDTSSNQSVGVVFIHPIAAQIHAGTSLTKADEEFLNEIFPLKKGWNYNCYDATVLFYKGVNFQPVQQDPVHIAEIFTRLSLANPQTTINHFICLSSFIWQIQQPKDVYLETILTSNINASDYEDWQTYAVTVEQRSKMPLLRDFITTSIEKELLLDPNKILWRPAIYMYAFILALIAAIAVSRNKFLFILMVPLLLQSLIIAFTAQLQALRYQYPVYLISMLFSTPLFYLAVKNAKKTK